MLRLMILQVLLGNAAWRRLTWIRHMPVSVAA